jgi:hypothetical protein
MSYRKRIGRDESPGAHFPGPQREVSRRPLGPPRAARPALPAYDSRDIRIKSILHDFCAIPALRRRHGPTVRQRQRGSNIFLPAPTVISNG